MRLLPRPRPTAARRRESARRFRPQLDALEDRRTPAAIVNYNDFFTHLALDPASGDVYGTALHAQTADADPGPGRLWMTGPGEYLAEYTPAGALVRARDAASFFGPGGSFVNLAAVTDPGTGQTALYVLGGNSLATLGVTKLNPDWTVAWTQTIGAGNSLAVDAAAGAVYVGDGFSGTVDFDPNHVSPGDTLTANGGDGVVVKLDAATGAFQWASQIGGGNNQGVGAVAVQGGSVYVAGSFSGTMTPTGFTDQGAVNTSASADSFVLRLDPATGAYVAGSGSQFVDATVNQVVPDAGGVYLAGQFQRTADLNPSPTATFNVTPTGVPAGQLGPADIFLERLDTTGAMVWAEQVGGTGDDTVGQMALYSGQLYLGGSFSNTVDFDPSAGQTSLTAAGGNDAFVARYGTDGSLGYARQMGSSSPYGVAPASEKASLIAVNAAGVYATGFFAPGQADFDPGPGTAILTDSADWDGFLVGLTPAGTYQWADQLESMVRTVDDGGPGYAETGTGWTGNTGGYQGDNRTHAKGSGTNKATWTFTGLPPGTYEVQVTWVANSKKGATNAPYKVNGGSPVLVNQQVSPGDYGGDAAWKSLGTYTVDASGTLTVELSDAANGVVSADAVRVVLKTPA